jgi:ABC-type multidrug transport system, ATPase component
METENAIEVTGLTHRFGERTALNDLSYTVKSGEIFALLGPNGAGKTTTIRLLNGLYQATAGKIAVLGLNPMQHGDTLRGQTGVLTETNALYERLSARQNLAFFGSLYGMSGAALQDRIEELLQFFNLKERAEDKVATYSKGMKQRLALARAILNHPRILFLDEPTSSLDPESAQQVHELIRSMRAQNGHTVFLCTHHLEEAERLADRVAILNSGKLLALGSVAELSQKYNPGLWVEVDLWRPLEAQPDLRSLDGVLKVEPSASHLRIQVREEAVIPALANELVRQKAQILSLTPKRVTLEEIYFGLQESARQGTK